MNEWRAAVEERFDEAREFLSSLVRFPSVSGGGETEIQDFVAERFGALGEVETREVPEDLKRDPQYTFGDHEFDYSGRKNVVLRFPSKGAGRSLILNSHVDVVPAEHWKEAFSPRLEDGILYGRGACDAKGQVATMYLALCALRDSGVTLSGALTAQAVIEEEVGGNGTLALIRQGYRADGVIVLEPTSLRIKAANRGAVWFALEVTGKPVHMGKIREGVNAIEKTCFLMDRMREYEKRLIEESRDYPLFEQFEQPVQVNFGVMRGEGWPSMVCGRAVLEGGVGFLPNKNLELVKKELDAVVRDCGDDWIPEHYRLTFPRLHNDAYEIARDHPLARALEEAAATAGIEPAVEGWIVSCDARLFSRVGEMPVVVFGPGAIEDAHSNNEKLELEQMKQAAAALAEAIVRWCGRENS